MADDSDHQFVKELMVKHKIGEEEQERVMAVVSQHNISNRHFEFYLQSFKFFDRNPEDNTIKHDELADALRCFGLNPTTQDVQKLTTEFDTNSKRDSTSSTSDNNSSQMIELSEFIQMARVILDKHDPDALENAFRFFDINKDGFISADELKKAMTEHGDPLSDEEVQEMLQELDIDKDNRINVHEFIALLKSHDQL